MHVHVEKDKCISSGHCTVAAPDVFDQYEDSGVVFLRTDHPAPEQEGDVRDAVSMCPVLAITVTEK